MTDLDNVTVGQAISLFLTKQYDKSAKAWAELSRSFPDNMDFLANRLLSSFYADTDDVEAFDACLTQCEQDLNEEKTKLLYALLPFFSEDEDLYCDMLIDFLEKNSSNLAVIRMLADFWQKNDKEALKDLLINTFGKFSFDERMLCLHARYAFENHNIQQASFLYARALKKNRSYTICQYDFLFFLECLGKYKKIIRYVQDALKILPQDTVLKQYLLEALIHVRQLKKAEKIFNELNQKPEEMSFSVRMFWAKTLALKEQYAQAFDAAYFFTSEENDFSQKIFLSEMLLALKTKNQDDSCLERMTRWQDDFPDDEFSFRICAALAGETQLPTSSAFFVETIFDYMADDYDDIMLNKTKYCAPEKVDAILKRQRLVLKKNHHVLDLGCGTGLMGPVLKKYTGKKGNFTGVDVSQKMLNHALKKKIYKRLVRNDILSFLAPEKETYDLISCIDVSGNFGDLQPLIKAVYRTLRSGGKFVFTISLNTFSAEAFSLLPKGRYVHSAQYTETLFEQEGFKILQKEETSLRKEKDKPVLSVIYLIGKE